MNIQDLLAPEVMILDLQATTKRAALKEIIASLYNAGKIRDEQEFLEGILAREAQTTTGLGEGIAMPHSKNAVSYTHLTLPTN